MRLRDQHIFILSIAKYDDEIESTMLTMARQACNNYVYYIEKPFTWKDCLLSQRKTIAARKKHFSMYADGIVDTDLPNLKIVICPPVASINWLPENFVYRSALKMNEQIIANRIAHVIDKYDIEDYIFINSFNFYYPGLATRLSPKLSVYHCVDPLVFPVDRKHGLVSEHEVVHASDLVICTSKKLFDEKIKINPNTYFIPNAADIKHSSKALLSELPVHESLAGITSPVAGYFGAIERRMNFDLLDYVTEINKDISFVFVGPVSKEFVPSWFYTRSNICLTGPVSYAHLPGILKGFDVTIIPFKKDAFSANIFPLKLFEYLGAGKPVVATDFNTDLKDFTGETVSYCKDANSFSDALLAALSNSSPQQILERTDVARQNTWEKRAEEFGNLIDSYITGKERKKSANTMNSIEETIKNNQIALI